MSQDELGKALLEADARIKDLRQRIEHTRNELASGSALQEKVLEKIRALESLIAQTPRAHVLQEAKTELIARLEKFGKATAELQRASQEQEAILEEWSYLYNTVSDALKNRLNG